MKSWRTVLENQTEQANEEIQNILQKDYSPRKKFIAVSLAVVGISLMAVGIAPLLLNNNEQMSASITTTDTEQSGLTTNKFVVKNNSTTEENIATESTGFNNTAEEITDLNTEATTPPDAIGDLNPDDFNPIASDTETTEPTEDLFINADNDTATTPTETTEEDQVITSNTSIEDLMMHGSADEQVVDADLTNSNTSFRINMHTGTADQEETSVNATINTTPTTTSATTSTTTVKNKITSQTTVKTGPETWMIGLASLLGAFAIQRKKRKQEIAISTF